MKKKWQCLLGVFVVLLLSVIQIGLSSLNNDEYLNKRVGCCFEEYDSDNSGCKRSISECEAFQEWRTNSGTIVVGPIGGSGSWDYNIGCASSAGGVTPHEDEGCIGEERKWTTGDTADSGWKDTTKECDESRKTGNCTANNNTKECVATQVSDMNCGSEWNGGSTGDMETKVWVESCGD